MHINIKLTFFWKNYLKCFTRYENNNDNVTGLINKLPKLNKHMKHFGKVKYITFLLKEKNESVLQKHTVQY